MKVQTELPRQNWHLAALSCPTDNSSSGSHAIDKIDTSRIRGINPVSYPRREAESISITEYPSPLSFLTAKALNTPLCCSENALRLIRTPLTLSKRLTWHLLPSYGSGTPYRPAKCYKYNILGVNPALSGYPNWPSPTRWKKTRTCYPLGAYRAPATPTMGLQVSYLLSRDDRVPPACLAGDSWQWHPPI